MLCFLSVYAPQCGLSDSVKDLFYDQIRAVTAMIPASEFLIPCGDWNGHGGSTGSGYKEVHGGYGYGKPDPDTRPLSPVRQDGERRTTFWAEYAFRRVPFSRFGSFYFQL